MLWWWKRPFTRLNSFKLVWFFKGNIYFISLCERTKLTIGGIFGLVFAMYHHNSIMCVQRLMNFNGPRQFYNVCNFKLFFFWFALLSAQKDSSAYEVMVINNTYYISLHLHVVQGRKRIPLLVCVEKVGV